MTRLRFGAKLRYSRRIPRGYSGRMAHHPMFEPDPAKADSSAAENHEEEGSLPGGSPSSESDLVELAAKFTVHGGGRLSPELSAELALEVVLNEIVEQACIATGGSGAAIVLERAGEWVCRASAGECAPELGSRLDAEAGLSGACVKTRLMQRCDDAQSDPRADMAASRNLGVRSVMILPLLLKEELLGVFEVFSSRASAFGDREERGVEALAQRAIQNVERASGRLQGGLRASKHDYPTMAELIVADLRMAEAGAAEPATTDIGTGNLGAEHSRAHDAEPFDESSDVEYGAEQSFLKTQDEATSGRGVHFVTWVLGLMVLSAAILLAVLAGQRLSGGAPRRHARVATAGAERNQIRGHGEANSAEATKKAESVSSGAKGSGSAVPAGAARASAPPAGGLAVYEKGKEIFRLPPSRESEVGNAAALPEDDGVVHRVEPAYPEEAREQGIEGAVVADVFIDRDGKVVDVKTVSGAPVLAQAVSDAVKQWTFRPRGAPMETRVTLNFRLPH